MSGEIVSFEPSPTFEQALERAAELWGIEPGYRDTWGQWHETPPAVKRAILKSLGVPGDTLEELDRAVEERLWSEWSALTPPVVVLGEQSRALALNVPAALAEGVATIEIRLEEGGQRGWEVALKDLSETGGITLHEVSFVRKNVPLAPDLPLGYHEAVVTLPVPGGEAARSLTRLILCPDRAWAPPAMRDSERRAGLAVALYGLRSARNWGCGDFTDLEQFLDWLADEVGVSFVGLNPLHDIGNRRPFNASPYLPTSTLYKNPIYLDVERIEDFRNSRRARAWLATPEVQAELEALRSSELVDYERVHALKLEALKLAFAAFLGEFWRNGPRVRGFQEFVRQEGELLERHATYRALEEWIHARRPDVWVWPDWPEAHRDPDSEAVRRFAKKHWRAVMFYQWIQWQLDLQLAAAQLHARARGLEIGLYHDLALATDRCGADFWAHRSFYVSGCRVGAPPDGFAPKGQDWSFPPPDAGRHRQDGYRLLVESVRHNCRHGGALRIDHVMRFFRLYWIPEGGDATEGAYVREPWEDLLRILALESVRRRVIIIGEDLGTVTPQMRQALARFGLLGYQVPYFEKNERGEFRLPEEYRREALVSSSTHDLPTLAGFWLGRDIEARRAAGLLPDEAAYQRQWAERAADKQKLLDLLHRLGLLPEWVPRWAGHLPELTGELHNAVVGFLAGTPCRLMVLNQEDLFKETEQQNLPASIAQYPNWQRKMKFSLDQLSAYTQARDFVAMFRNWLERSGRGARGAAFQAANRASARFTPGRSPAAGWKA